MGKRKKKADISVSIKPDRSGADIVMNEPIVQDIVDEEVVVQEELKEEPEDDLLDEIKLAIAGLPTPLFSPTQRGYGEEFLPEYIKVRNKLRRLAGLNGQP